MPSLDLPPGDAAALPAGPGPEAIRRALRGPAGRVALRLPAPAGEARRRVALALLGEAGASRSGAVLETATGEWLLTEAAPADASRVGALLGRLLGTAPASLALPEDGAALLDLPAPAPVPPPPGPPGAAGVDRRMLIFRPDRLEPLRRRQGQVALLREGWDGLRRTSRTHCFELPRGGLAAVEAPPGQHLAEAHAAIAAMLEPAEAAAALLLLRLPEEAAAVLDAIEESLGLAAAVEAAAPRPGRAPDGAAVAQVERALLSADLTAFLRRRRVCRLLPSGGAPEPLWEDRRVAIDDLRDALLPGTDLALAPGLARRFRRSLDARLLAGLSRPEDLRDIGPLSLALGLPAATSAEFLRLDALWPAALRGALTVLLAAEDAAGDPAGFAFARDFLVARGHRVMLDAAGPAAVLAVPPARAGVGLLRLRHSAALPPLGSPVAEALRALLPAEPEAVVLAGVDRPAAIAWGWEMGITLFQGRLIESRRPAA